MSAHQMEEQVPVPPGLHRQVCPQSLRRASAPSSQGPNGLFFCAGHIDTSQRSFGGDREASTTQSSQARQL